MLRSVAASSSLAVALLGLGSSPVHAKATLFAPLTGASNPLDGQDVGGFSAPAFGDLDGDGDLDLVVGERAGTFHYFENTGSATSPAYVERTGSANPLNGQDIGFFSAPALGDLDGDGDLDLISGEEYGSFAYFENTGSATAPAFIRRTGAGNPLDGRDVGLASAPALADLDRDGDLDLVAGGYDGKFRYFENTGSATSPAFVPRTGAANPLNSQDVGYYSVPALGDLDGDGDLDLVAGELEGTLFTFENLSNRMVARTGAANPLDGQDAGDDSAPALGDLDGDGDLDLVAGDQFGAFHYFENTGSATSPAFLERTFTANPLYGWDVGDRSVPALADLDGDGDLDLVAGNFSGTFAYFENVVSATSPGFVPRTGAANPLDGKDVGVFAAPALGDLDGDGDPDVVAGESSGTFHTYYLPEPAQGLMLGAGAALLKLLERWRGRRRRER